MDNIPSIKTERLILRPLSPNDAKAIFAYARLKSVGPNAGWTPHTSIKETQRFINLAINKQRKNQPGVWVICEHKKDDAIGTIEIHSYEGYKAEIGFVLHPDYWNKGYVTEAAEAVMVYAFEHLKLKRLAYAHFLDNDASARVREKLGFTVEGIKRNGFKHEDGRVLDEMIASFTFHEYFEQYNKRFAKVKSTMTLLP